MIMIKKYGFLITFIPVPEHHNPLRADRPAERLDLPRIPLEALWRDARFCTTCLAATGGDYHDDGGGDEDGDGEGDDDDEASS